MITRGREKGLLIFGLIVFIAAVASLAAYQITGDKGIEDRFSQAVGLPLSGEEVGPALFGFSVEGNPVLYLAVLGVLLVISYLLYRRFMEKQD
jgi:ABC-type Na+ efflux pump permease subunit